MVKIIVSYSTKEKVNQTEFTYQLKSRTIKIKPLKIIRRSCGRGKASNRFFYEVIFKAPEDAAFNFDGTLTENIWRKMNPQFKPKDFVFINNVCDLTGENE